MGYRLALTEQSLSRAIKKKNTKDIAYYAALKVDLIARGYQ